MMIIDSISSKVGRWVGKEGRMGFESEVRIAGRIPLLACFAVDVELRVRKRRDMAR